MKRVRIGNQSAFSAQLPVMPFEYAVHNGFDAFEWFPDKHDSGQGWEVRDLDPAVRSGIKDNARQNDIVQSVHISLEADPRIPEKHELIVREIGFALDIGATLVNIHFFADGGVDSFVTALWPVVTRTAEAGLRLSIENTPFTGPGEFNDLFRALQKKGGELTAHVGMCLDLGHANLHETSRNDYLSYMDQIDEAVPIIHIHLHENNGDCDSHLTFFTGPSGKKIEGVRGFVDRMKKRKFEGSVILEQWPQPPHLLNEARNRLNEMFNS